jgi:hypothetical protein
MVLDELSGAVATTFEERQWQPLQDQIEKQCKILLITSGSQCTATDPNMAAISGIFRVIRRKSYVSA